MTSILMIVMMLLNLLWWVVIIQAVFSWLLAFDVLNVRQPFVYQIWSGMNRLTEPLYRPIRNILPPMGGLDLAPIGVLIGISVLQIVIVNNAGAF